MTQEPVMVNLRVLSRSAKRVFIRVAPRVENKYRAGGKPLLLVHDIYPLIVATVDDLFPRMKWRRRFEISKEILTLIDQLLTLDKIPASATKH